MIFSPAKYYIFLLHTSNCSTTKPENLQMNA